MTQRTLLDEERDARNDQDDLDEVLVDPLPRAPDDALAKVRPSDHGRAEGRRSSVPASLTTCSSRAEDAAPRGIVDAVARTPLSGAIVSIGTPTAG